MSTRIQSILAVLILMSGISNGQGKPMYGIFPSTNGRILYNKTIQVDGMGKNDIFSKSKQWMLDEYKEQKDSAQLEDQGKGLLSREGFTTVSFNQPGNNTAVDWRCWHIITINASDDHAKISVSNLELKTPSGYGTIVVTKLEDLRKKIDSLPRSSFFGANTKAKYWQNQVDALKQIDSTINKILESFEATITDKNKSGQ